MSHSCKRAHSTIQGIRPQSALSFDRPEGKANLLREFLEADQWKDRKSVRDYFHKFLKQQNRVLAYYGFIVIGLLILSLTCLIIIMLQIYFANHSTKYEGNKQPYEDVATADKGYAETTLKPSISVPNTTVVPANCFKVLSSISFARSTVSVTFCTPTSDLKSNFIVNLIDRATKVQHQIDSTKAAQLFEYLAECYESSQCWTNQQPLPKVSCSSYQACERWTVLSNESRDILFCNPGHSKGNLIHLMRIGNVKLVCSQIWLLFKELQKHVV